MYNLKGLFIMIRIKRLNDGCVMATDSGAEEQACVWDNDGVGWPADGLAFCQVPTPLHSQ